MENENEDEDEDEMRYDWTPVEIRALHDMPLLDLVYRAAGVHRRHHDASRVQICRLISIKTGGCPEDCAYCSQSSRYDTGIESGTMLDPEVVVQTARRAKAEGVTRVCLGAAWREVRDNAQFERVLGMVREVRELGIEVCCTLGMLTEDQARRLEEAGLSAYNHNLDTSESHYANVITTRTYQDRIETLRNVRKTRVTLCTGGILGLGEGIEDRVALLRALCTMRPHPESVPVNVLSKVAGTPLAEQADVPFNEMLRFVATARIVMPGSIVRLSAGRVRLGEAEQAICFLAGANSIFSSDTGTMLTAAVASPRYESDHALLGRLGLRPMEAQLESAGMGQLS